MEMTQKRFIIISLNFIEKSLYMSVFHRLVLKDKINGYSRYYCFILIQEEYLISSIIYTRKLTAAALEWQL